MAHTWWGPFAVWDGGLGIWGGILAGTLAGLFVLRRRQADIPRFLDAAAPALLVAQSIGCVGNYFNQELFGKPTTLPWALRIDPAHRDRLEPHARWGPRLARPPSPHPPRRPLRPLRRRLFGLPHLRRAAAHRPGPPHHRPTPELLHREPALHRWAHGIPANPTPYHADTHQGTPRLDACAPPRAASEAAQW